MFEVGDRVHWNDRTFEGDGTVKEVHRSGSRIMYIVMEGTCPARFRKTDGYDRYGFYEEHLTAI